MRDPKWTFFILIALLGCSRNYERQVVVGNKVAAIIFEENGKQGLKDTLGNVLLSARFDYIEDFVECGVIKVDSGGHRFRDHDLVGYQTEKIGLINLKGNVVVEPQYDGIVFNWFPLALVCKEGKYGYIDNKGIVKIPIEYLNATPFQEGFAIVKTKTGYGLIDSTNSFIIRPENDSLDLAYATGFSKDTMLVIINNHQKTFMLDKRGELFAPVNKNR